MANLDLPRPAVNGTQPINCTVCGAMIALRAGGGSVRGGPTDDEVLALVKLHSAWHRALDDWHRALDGKDA